MRLSTSMMYQQSITSLSSAQSEWMKVGEQLSTGKRVINPSDDPTAASQLVLLSQSQAENSQYRLARSFARQSVSTEETVLKEVSSTIQEIQVLVVNAGNDALSDDDRDSLATQLQGLKDLLLNQANSTDGNGRYLFGGFASDSPPFAENASGQIEYRGSDEAIRQKVDASRVMTVGHTGSAVFMSLTSNPVKEPGGDINDSEKNLFNTLDLALKSLRTPLQDADEATRAQVTAELDKANRGLRNSLNNVLSVRAELGTQLKEMDVLDSIGADRSLASGMRISELEDVDWNAAISSYMLQQLALQAAQKTFSDMQNLSLFKLNR